jgi:hypothetical protein
MYDYTWPETSIIYTIWVSLLIEQSHVLLESHAYSCKILYY